MKSNTNEILLQFYRYGSYKCVLKQVEKTKLMLIAVYKRVTLVNGYEYWKTIMYKSSTDKQFLMSAANAFIRAHHRNNQEVIM